MLRSRSNRWGTATQHNDGSKLFWHCCWLLTLYLTPPSACPSSAKSSTTWSGLPCIPDCFSKLRWLRLMLSTLLTPSKSMRIPIQFQFSSCACRYSSLFPNFIFPFQPSHSESEDCLAWRMPPCTLIWHIFHMFFQLQPAGPTSHNFHQFSATLFIFIPFP